MGTESARAAPTSEDVSPASAKATKAGRISVKAASRHREKAWAVATAGRLRIAECRHLNPTSCRGKRWRHSCGRLMARILTMCSSDPGYRLAAIPGEIWEVRTTPSYLPGRRRPASSCLSILPPPWPASAAHSMPNRAPDPRARAGGNVTSDRRIRRSQP